MLRTIRTGMALVLLAGASFAVQSAGLGNLVVSSTLGQVLAAEIDLVSLETKDVEALTARVASPEAYKEAMIEFSPALRSLRFSVQKRASGLPYLKITSVVPISEPFLNLLIEVTWPSGRLHREYPILLDPPGFAEARQTAPLAAAPSPTPAAPAAAAPTTTPMPDAPAAPSAKSELAATAPAAPKAGSTPGSYGPVRKGENLTRIATGLKSATVSMDQMLVALYRENRSAFIDNNMNLLKAGQILRVPSAEAVAAVTASQARREVRTHVANWKAYRTRLAGSVAAMPAREGPARSATGTVSPVAVTPPPAPLVAARDILKLSKTEGGKGSGASGKAAGARQDRLNALQEEVIAKEKALAESQSRVADLEKQVKDMQRLLALRGTGPAAPDAAPKVPDAKVAAAKPVEGAAKPTETTPPADGATPVDAGKAETKTGSATPPAAAKVEEAAKPAPAPPKPSPKPAPPPPEPNLVDQLLDNPAIIAGGVGIAGLLGLGGFLFVRNRRKSLEAAAPESAATSAFPSDLQLTTGDIKSGGGLVDTGNSSFLSDFDKTGTGAIDSEEVDPVAEAEVYIAYGRDAQAEEILKDVMTRGKVRPEVPLKLLEIYHARKSAPEFESVARTLQSLVGSDSPTWKVAAAMGMQIDPTNALYELGPDAATEVLDIDLAREGGKHDLDFELDSGPGTDSSRVGVTTASRFDFALDAGKAAEPDLAVSDAIQKIDFDLAHAEAPPSVDLPLSPADDKHEFDLDVSGQDLPPSLPRGSAAPPAAPLPEKTLADLPSSVKRAASPGLADLNLDDDEGVDDGANEIDTKFELARAYLEIGDKDGAREILQEVAREGSAAQKAEALKLIASL